METEVTENTVKKTRKRPKRVPLGKRDVLTAPPREGYYRYFANDDPGNIERMQQAGYEVVKGNVSTGDNRAGKTSKTDSTVSVSAGGGVKAVLMEIPLEYHKEDVEAEQLSITDKERSMKQKFNTHTDGSYGYVK